jgi:hypothetical protein
MRRVFIGRDAKFPCLLPLVVILVTIALSDLALFVLCLACSTPLLHRGLLLVEDFLLRERCLGRDKVGTLQL